MGSDSRRRESDCTVADGKVETSVGAAKGLRMLQENQGNVRSLLQMGTATSAPND